MAITAQKAAQLAEGYRRYPIEDHGKLRVLYGKATQSGVGDSGSSWEIGKLPQGRVRLLPYLCRYKVSALGAARVMAIGHDAYYALSNPPTSPPVAAASAAFASAVDVSAATDAFFPVTGGMKHDLYSRDGITLRATITGGAGIPDLATGEFNFVYAVE